MFKLTDDDLELLDKELVADIVLQTEEVQNDLDHKVDRHYWRISTEDKLEYQRRLITLFGKLIGVANVKEL